MSNLRYTHDFVNMYKPMHRAFLELLLLDFLEKGGTIKRIGNGK